MFIILSAFGGICALALTGTFGYYTGRTEPIPALDALLSIKSPKNLGSINDLPQQRPPSDPYTR